MFRSLMEECEHDFEYAEEFASNGEVVTISVCIYCGDEFED